MRRGLLQSSPLFVYLGAMSSPRKKNRNNSTASPCVERCKIVERIGVCRGCGRTRDEISGWANASEERRKQILAELKARAALMVEDDENKRPKPEDGASW